MRAVFLIALSIVATLLAGCRQIEAPTLSYGEIIHNRNSDGTHIQKPHQRVLSAQELEVLNIWLKKNTPSWSAHNPMATLLPSWCISGFKPIWEVRAFCRYDNRIVAITESKRFEHVIDSGTNDLSFGPR